MTCETIREALLTAELAELRGEGSGPVATHLRTCTLCRREAGTILAATGRLAVRVQGRRRRRVWVAALPIAAAAGLVLMLRPSPTVPVPSPSTLASTVPAVETPPAPASALPMRPTTTPVAHRRRPISRSAPVRPTAFTAVAFAAIPLSVSPIRPSDEAPGRKQPKVLPTSDPSITVLWFE